MKQILSRIIFFSLCLFIRIQAENKTDLIVFSFDRPLQLYSLLESTDKHVTGINTIAVIYRASNSSFADGYQTVKKQFEHVAFYKQSDKPREDFKPLTIQAFQQSTVPYVMFAVDDIVVKTDIDLAEVIQFLETTKAYGFYFRLGKNLSECYPYNNRAQAVPPLKQASEDVQIYSWQFKQGQFDWNYPHTVDMTLYRKQDIQNHIKNLQYHTPNHLEAQWDVQSNRIRHLHGLCYKESKIVNLPLNRVQNEFQNRCMNLTPQELLVLFNDGKKMDIVPIEKIVNKAAHMDYQPTFIIR